MIKIKNLSIRNFLSIGNAQQYVNFDRTDLTLVLGENLDLGGADAGVRNGCGKSSLLNAISYALYGQALTNIRKDNLVNLTNGKNMVVVIEFECAEIQYKIERGRKPNVMKFWVGGSEKQITDEAQGDSRETQTEIERILGMSHDMFKHIVALNSDTEPFLGMKANDQRDIIEQLLGITLLSEKADKLKEQIKQSKEQITSEEYRIKAVNDANIRIQGQIESVKQRQIQWKLKYDDDLTKLEDSLSGLMKIEIDDEISNHRQLNAYRALKKSIDDKKDQASRASRDLARITKNQEKLVADILKLSMNKCHTCDQEFHDEKHLSVLHQKKTENETDSADILRLQTLLQKLNDDLVDLDVLGDQPKVFYKHEEDAIHHRSTLANLQDQIVLKLQEEDPYSAQIEEMSTVGIEEVTYDLINTLTSYKEHQEFLLKLLTSKDSFIRKRIIDQNLSYLNGRLAQYLDRIGLPHQVKFNNDLSVSITELGRDLDFHNLSKGEKNRLIISLSFAFRDVWESLYQPINLLYVDEIADTGMDSAGTENCLQIMKQMGRENQKSIWLVSHKDELIGRVDNILRAVKSNGFTTFI